MLRVLTFSSLYPNAADTRHGIFVEQRLRQICAAKPLAPLVVAPVPWVPVAGRFMAGHAARLGLTPEAVRHGIPVVYPRYLHVPAVGMSIAPLLMAAAVQALVARIRRERHPFELIDAQYFYPDGVAAAIVAGRIGVPFTITARGSDLNLIARYAVPLRWIRWAARRAAAVITVSAALKRTFEALDTGQPRVEVLPNGVDTEVFRPRDRRVARAAVSAADRPTLIAVGNLRAEKGVDLAIETLARLPDVQLLILGDGPERERLAQLARAAGVEARVSFRGVVAQERLPDFYSAADVTLLCSTREGMPNVVLESVACGTPVVAADVGGVAEVLKRREAGALFTGRSPEEVAGRVREVLARSSPQAEVARCADELSWAPTVARQFELFAAIAAGRAGR